MTRISVVTPSFRHAKYLERTIASVAGQQHPDVEYLVVDGGSDDGSLEILDRWSQSIDVLVVEPDEGQADALRKGFALASGEMFAWINSDDCYAHSGALTTLCRWLETHPETDLVYGRRFFIDENGGFTGAWPYRVFDEEALRHACYLPQESCVFRRSAYEAVGGIDRSFSFALDYDLWIRMLDAGCHFEAITDVVGLFRSYSDQKTQRLWEEVGLVEIARIHRRSIGTTIDDDEMQADINAYLYGGVASAWSSGDRGRDVSEVVNALRSEIFRGRALDRWPWHPGMPSLVG